MPFLPVPRDPSLHLIQLEGLRAVTIITQKTRRAWTQTGGHKRVGE